jgi:hypothetical protein
MVPLASVAARLVHWSITSKLSTHSRTRSSFVVTDV